MIQVATPGSSLGAGAPLCTAGSVPAPMAPNALLDLLIPGFSVLSDAVYRYLQIDVSIYIPMVLAASGLVFAWRYLSEYIWGLIQKYCMSTVDVRTDDELYNYIMAWVAAQKFSRDSRRFIANTNLSSRSWWAFRSDRGDDDDDEGDAMGRKKMKPLAYTPNFGSHYFWYRARLLIFHRDQNRDQGTFLTVSEREEVRITCFGRNPWIIKELLNDAREMYMKRDESKTLIYRGSTKGGTTEPTWQRCMARTSRPFSTVILNEKVKKDLIDDVTDYLNPATRRWYSNRGIPYRRGYLLHGPPGTGKSSLSLALAGFFKMRIYIVSLSSITANEENLSSLFAELPRRCVVLLEDIDSAGLTHTREGEQAVDDVSSGGGGGGGKKKKGGKAGKNDTNGQQNTPIGRLSLSGLLNILDGVASQEGRVLIMTTNHVEKLDKALIRPGRVDMIVKFDKADRDMTVAIFKAIYARLEGDDLPATTTATTSSSSPTSSSTSPVKSYFGFMSSSSARATADQEARDKRAEREKEEQEERVKKEAAAARVEKLAELFADHIPAHEFSPAEIQGYLLKNKRDPDAAVGGAEAWALETRKEKQEREREEAEEKRKAEEDEKKKQEEEAAGEKEKKDRKKSKSKKTKSRSKKGKKGQRKGSGDESDEGSGSESSGSESESEEDEEEAAAAETDAGATTTAVNKKSKATAGVSKKPVEDPAAEKVVESSVVVVETAEVASGKGAEDGIIEESKHGGDSGYGTP